MTDALREALVVRAHRAGGQRELAANLGCTQSTVSRLIAGELTLSAPMARAVLRAYPELRPEVEAAILGLESDNEAPSRAVA